jgi:hypothetical protein
MPIFDPHDHRVYRHHYIDPVTGRWTYRDWATDGQHLADAMEELGGHVTRV